MPLPRWVAYFNKRVTNRFMEPVARRFSNFAVIHHVGRKSGTEYATPVNWFAVDATTMIVALTYGPRADWVRNLRSGDGWLEIGSTHRQVAATRLVGRPQAWPHLPLLVRFALRVLTVHDFLEITADSSL